MEFIPELVAERPVRFPKYSGHLVRAVVLKVIGDANPFLSRELHEPNRPKGYSVTGLYFRSSARTQDAYFVDITTPCRFKVRFLEDEHGKAFLSNLQGQEELTFAGAPFRIASTHVRHTSYQKLLDQAEKTDVFRLVFKSPTYLACKGTGFHILFPEPRRLFMNLAKLWNAYAHGLEFQDLNAYSDWVRINLGVTGYELSTRHVKFGVREAIGFAGWANFRMIRRDNWSKVTCALARFAELSNVGSNRTGGFGVVKFHPKLTLSS